MVNWRVPLIPLLWCAASGSAPRAEADEVITFSPAREIILQYNDGLQSAQTETEAARAGVDQAGVLPNPGVGVVLEKFGANEIEATVEQTFELGGKRRLRTEIAQKDLDAAINIRHLTRLELEAEIVRRFVPIAIASGKLSVLDSLIEIATAGKEQIKNRVDAGASRKTDLQRAEIELDRYALERCELARALEQARKNFAALGGDRAARLRNVTGSPDLKAEIPPLDDLLKAIATSPQITAYEIERARLAAQRKLLRAEAIPDLRLSAGVLSNRIEQYTSPLAGLSMDVPLFNKNRAAQKQIELRGRALAQRKEYNLNLARTEIENLHGRLVSIDEKIFILQSSTIPKAQSVYSMLQEYYDAGSAGFLDLTAARTEMFNVQMDLIDIEAERALALTDLMQLTSLRIQIIN